MQDAETERPWTHSVSVEGNVMTILIGTIPTTWKRPVRLRIGEIALEPVHNSYEALACLHNRWPTEQGLYFQAAKFVCHQSVAGTAMNRTGFAGRSNF